MVQDVNVLDEIKALKEELSAVKQELAFLKNSRAFSRATALVTQDDQPPTQEAAAQIGGTGIPECKWHHLMWKEGTERRDRNGVDHNAAEHLIWHQMMQLPPGIPKPKNGQEPQMEEQGKWVFC